MLRYANTGRTRTPSSTGSRCRTNTRSAFRSTCATAMAASISAILYKPNGDIDLQNCGGYLWSTGEQLRKSSDASLAARLRQSGPRECRRSARQWHWRIRRGDEPPLLSYFIDYDDRFDDDAARGHMGDVAIARVCTPQQRAQLLPRVLVPAPLTAGARYRHRPRASDHRHHHHLRRRAIVIPGQVQRGGTGQCFCGRPNVLIGGQCCSPQDLAPGGKCASSNCAAGTNADRSEQCVLQQ